MSVINTPAGVTPPPGGFQNGGWYGGQQYWNGQFGNANVINNPNQKGYGQEVSKDVVQQTNPNNVDYLANKGATFQSFNSGSSGNPGGGSAGGTGGAGLSMGNQPAVPSLSGIYDQYYTNNPDVKAANDSITGLQKQISDRQAARDLAEKNINDNPFYAEGTRVGKVSKLNEEANNDMNTLNGQLSTAQQRVANFQAEAERQVNLSQGQYTLNNQAWKQNLDEFNTLLSQGGLENASPQTLAALSVSTGISSDMLSSIQKTQQAKNTQIVTSTDNSGNLTIAAINAKTGQVVNTQTLAGVGAAKTGGGKINVSDGLSAMTPKVLSRLNSYGNISPQDWQTAQAAWIAAGLSKSDFVSNFGQYADVNRDDFLQAYGFSNPKTTATIKNNQAQNTKPVK